jgi:hypothetical protein
MKLKFNQSTIDAVQAQTTDNIKELIKSPAMWSEIGDVVIKDIKRVARTGKNPITGGSFIPLSKAWIKERGKIAESTALNDAFKQNRSNITITGQLLNAMAKRIIPKGIQIYFAGLHKPYLANYDQYFIRKKKKRTVRMSKKLQGFQKSHGGIEYVNTGREGKRTIGKIMQNDELAQYVGELRPFFYVRETLLPQLKTIVIRYIRRKL